MSRRTRFITVLMLVLSLGLHWSVLQSIAWVNMLVRYSAEGSFIDAVGKTFDGRHPCQICVLVKNGKQSEQEQKLFKSIDKADWLLTESALVLERPASTPTPPEAFPMPDTFGESPPFPPPRLA